MADVGWGSCEGRGTAAVYYVILAWLYYSDNRGFRQLYCALVLQGLAVILLLLYPQFLMTNQVKSVPLIRGCRSHHYLSLSMLGFAYLRKWLVMPF